MASKFHKGMIVIIDGEEYEVVTVYKYPVLIKSVKTGETQLIFKTDPRIKIKKEVE